VAEPQKLHYEAEPRNEKGEVPYAFPRWSMGTRIGRFYFGYTIDIVPGLPAKSITTEITEYTEIFL